MLIFQGMGMLDMDSHPVFGFVNMLQRVVSSLLQETLEWYQSPFPIHRKNRMMPHVQQIVQIKSFFLLSFRGL